MKAEPALPTMSAREVAALGAVPIAGRLVGFAPVRVPLRIGTAMCGLPELVDTRNGACWGICATAEIAERLKNFFA